MRYPISDIGYLSGVEMDSDKPLFGYHVMGHPFDFLQYLQVLGARLHTRHTGWGVTYTCRKKSAIEYPSRQPNLSHRSSTDFYPPGQIFSPAEPGPVCSVRSR